MKLNTIATLLFSWTFFSVLAQEIPQDTAVRYKVRASSWSISTVGSKITDQLTLNYYDSLGYVFKSIWTNFSDTNTMFFFYNKKGQNIRTYYENPKYKLKRETKHTYNDHGLLDSNEWGKINYRYDAKGREIEINDFYGGGKDETSRVIKQYDSLDRCIKRVNYVKNSLSIITTYYFDAKGVIKKESIALYDPNDAKKPVSAYDLLYFYNAKGLVTEKKQVPMFLAAGKNYTHNHVFRYTYTFY
jgi:hypothetical protein